MAPSRRFQTFPPLPRKEEVRPNLKGRRSREAATIFIAEVIFCVDLTLRMRSRRFLSHPIDGRAGQEAVIRADFVT
jgi:hypothetical protein